MLWSSVLGALRKTVGRTGLRHFFYRKLRSQKVRIGGGWRKRHEKKRPQEDLINRHENQEANQYKISSIELV